MQHHANGVRIKSFDLQPALLVDDSFEFGRLVGHDGLVALERQVAADDFEVRELAAVQKLGHWRLTRIRIRTSNSELSGLVELEKTDIYLRKVEGMREKHYCKVTRESRQCARKQNYKFIWTNCFVLECLDKIGIWLLNPTTKWNRW